MPYTLRLEPSAQADLRDINDLDPLLGEEVLDALEQLQSDPISRSSPADFPYPSGQKFEFFGHRPNHIDYFVAIFQYDELNNEIIVRAIGHEQS